MKVWIHKSLLLAGAVAISGLPASAQRVESALGGIALYESGVDVVRKLGSPTDIEAINFEMTVAGGPGGAPGGAGAPGGPGGAPTAAPTTGAGAGFAVPPLGMRQATGAPGTLAPPGQGGGAGARTPPAAAPPGGGGTVGAGATQYVRWIYERPGGQSINVVLNKFNKVVQIEAIGVSNPNIRTSGGIRLGSSLADVIRVYQNPDAYEIGADYFMVKFLQQSKVAFRLTREHTRAPYRVTGIVVSAGKA